MTGIPWGLGRHENLFPRAAPSGVCQWRQAGVRLGRPAWALVFWNCEATRDVVGVGSEEMLPAVTVHGVCVLEKTGQGQVSPVTNKHKAMDTWKDQV